MGEPSSSARSTAALLAEFEGEWVSRDPRAAATLLPPANFDDIDLLFARLGLNTHVPPEATALWTWHNGQVLTDIGDRIAGLWFYNLAEVERRHRRGMEAQAELALELPDLYRPEWIPIFNLRQDDGLLDCITGEVLLHTYHDVPNVVARQPSLAAVVELWLRAIRQQAWLFPDDDRARSEWDDRRMREITNGPNELAFM